MHLLTMSFIELHFHLHTLTFILLKGRDSCEYYRKTYHGFQHALLQSIHQHPPGRSPLGLHLHQNIPPQSTVHPAPGSCYDAGSMSKTPNLKIAC